MRFPLPFIIRPYLLTQQQKIAAQETKITPTWLPMLIVMVRNKFQNLIMDQAIYMVYIMSDSKNHTLQDQS